MMIIRGVQLPRVAHMRLYGNHHFERTGFVQTMEVFSKNY
jgi:hypothetical protein